MTFLGEQVLPWIHNDFTEEGDIAALDRRVNLAAEVRIEAIEFSTVVDNLGGIFENRGIGIEFNEERLAIIDANRDALEARIAAILEERREEARQRRVRTEALRLVNAVQQAQRRLRREEEKATPWSYLVDNRFAADAFANELWNTPSRNLISARLCSDCTQPLSFNRSISVSELRNLANNCPLCKLLLDVVARYHSDSQQPVHIVRYGSALAVAGGGPRILRLCADPEPSTVSSSDIQIGPPVLQTINRSSTGSSPYFELLRKWLQECDQSHECNRRKRPYWPTRVIFVGGSDPNILELKELAHIVEQDDREESEGGYIVLSHCWGTPTDEEKRRFCTTRENYRNRLEGFGCGDLPMTFQDAVQVTRKLDKEYLWIDSLCIIQGDEEDWKTEAGCMEKVFASAYCTIAASSATSCKDGFLERNTNSQYIQVQDISGRRLYVCDDIDDFSNDVDAGPLNQRAWVLQERVLSRRTIHFSATQTYWECGEGVRCENFTRLECPSEKENFVLDPQFPERLRMSGHDRTVDFIQFLFKKYSQCSLSNPCDRDTAISGLVKRIESVLATECRYGVFSCFFSRLLLWKLSDEQNTNRIAYKDREVPSWSWMAYSGGIDFLSNSRLMVPVSEDLQFDTDQHAIIVKVREFRNCQVERERKERAIISDLGRVGSLWVDIVADMAEDMTVDIDCQQCVVVGMCKDEKEDPKKTYFILIVRETSLRNGYERFGVGKVEARYVSVESRTGKLL